MRERNLLRQEGIVLNVMMRKFNTWLKIVRKRFNLSKETGPATALHVEKSMRDAAVGNQVKVVCSQVCGNILKNTKSYAKIFLDKNHHVDHPEKVIEKQS